MARLFGFEFKRAVDTEQIAPSFAPKETDDGAVIVAAGGSYGTYVDLDGTVRTEAELVTKYREMSLQPEIDNAVDEIVNETMSIDEDVIVSIVLDNLELPERVKKTIRDEFQNILELLNFQHRAYEIYRRWYVDGRLYYHVVIDDKEIKDGIKELRFIDPRKIRKIREVSRIRVPGGISSEAVVPQVKNEYYIYNDKGFNFGNKAMGPTTSGLKIAKDSIVQVNSGLTDTNGTMVLSYLHKAIKALNQLRTLEDALVIYRLARAPERRIWYIDVGNLPKMKAEQYVRDIMVKHKNRLIYDGATGEVRDDRKFMTMLEDYWLPRREGGRGTEVTTLPGGQTLGEMDDVLFFQKKLYQTLNVPVNRLNSDALFSLGRATEVTRDELKFARYISRLRGRFSMLFNNLLEKQLVLKGVMTVEEWQAIYTKVKYDYAKDNYFAELKDSEMLENRINLFSTMEGSNVLGRFYSYDWARKNVLHQDDDVIERMDSEIEEERDNPKYQSPEQQAEDEAGSGGGAEDAAVQPIADDDAVATTPETDNLDQKLREARMTVKLLKDKPNRSMSEQAKYRTAVQVIAQNEAAQKSKK